MSFWEAAQPPQTNKSNLKTKTSPKAEAAKVVTVLLALNLLPV